MGIWREHITAERWWKEMPDVRGFPLLELEEFCRNARDAGARDNTAVRAVRNRSGEVILRVEISR